VPGLRSVFNAPAAFRASIWELHAAMSMARPGAIIAAPACPRSSHFDWFAEDFDTPDVKEAEALLDTLVA
jgi:hypothetical protein